MYDLTMKEEREELRQMIDSAVPERIRSSCTDHLLSTLTILDKQDAEIAALKAERDRLAEINRTLVKDFNTMLRANCRISEECDRLRPAVFEAHETFRSYAKLHESKGTPEGAEKAAANNRLGDRMFAALSPEPPAAPISNTLRAINAEVAAWSQEKQEVLRRCVAGHVATLSQPPAAPSPEITDEMAEVLREPQCAPDPRYPTGKDLDASRGEPDTCTTALPYPAKRCGIYVIRCVACSFSVGVTTAGRPDDPRSVKIPCLKPKVLQ